MAANLVPTIEKTVNLAWNRLQAELPKLGGEAKPKAAADVFSYHSAEEGVRVTVNPVSFRLKEKAAAVTCNLYVAVSGISCSHHDAPGKSSDPAVSIRRLALS